MSKSKGGTILKIIAALAVLIALYLIFSFFDIQRYLKQVLDWVSGLGPWGPVAFVLIYIAAAILFLPGSILTLGAGVIFGVVKGSIVVIVAATLAATAAFLVGRYLARDWVARKISGNEKFEAIDQAVATGGWKIVALIRLSPIFPFNLLNYAFGITKVALRDYFFASLVGMIPGTIMYVYIGSLAGDLATLGTQERTRTGAEWTLYIVGLLATVAVTIYVTRIARKALDKKVDLKDSNG